MQRKISAEDNVRRTLRELGLAHTVAITRIYEDRVTGWPVGDTLLRRVVLGRWPSDPKPISQWFHGSSFSFREPVDARPCLQVCFHIVDATRYPAEYFVELDHDYYKPSFLLGLIGHAVEVARNAITGKVTDQNRVWQLLDRRFGPERMVDALDQVREEAYAMARNERLAATAYAIAARICDLGYPLANVGMDRSWRLRLSWLDPALTILIEPDICWVKFANGETVAASAADAPMLAVSG